uniref:Uncharacterized protein n=1 Tax=Timema douglasi TaxID=61478 RepID=A0A7R8ZBA1_TIMDO|nr:unnamed protein product [Timema douglasi]
MRQQPSSSSSYDCSSSTISASLRFVNFSPDLVSRCYVADDLAALRSEHSLEMYYRVYRVAKVTNKLLIATKSP